MPHTSMTVVVLSCLVALGAACAPREPSVGRTVLSNAELSTGRAGEAAEAVVEGAYADALAHGDEALAIAPDNAWGRYDRAVALHHLGRTDAAVEAYREAESQFGKDARWAKAISIYGRARTLDDAGRCTEAKAAYGEYARFVRPDDPRGAGMALRYGNECDPKTTTENRESDVSAAVVARDYPRAVVLSDVSPVDLDAANPWLDYNRAVALADLGRLDEAVAAFTSAEGHFAASDGDRRGRSLAVYGRARALDRAGKCTDARQAYEEYAAVVRKDEPASAASALRYARQCKNAR